MKTYHASFSSSVSAKKAISVPPWNRTRNDRSTPYGPSYSRYLVGMLDVGLFISSTSSTAMAFLRSMEVIALLVTSLNEIKFEPVKR